MIRVLLITLCLLSAGTASAETVSSAKDDASAQSLSSRATAAITYLTTSTVYVSAGRKNKLSEGSRLSVIRADSVVGTIEVINLSSDRASCKILESSGPFLVGDQVGWNAEDEGGVPTPLQLAPPGSTRLESGRSSTGSTQSWLRENGIRGRISGRYLTVRDRSGTGQNLSQPALDARLEGRQIGGSDWDLSLDVRARRTFREEANGTNSQEGRSRVYRANLSWKPLDSRVSLMMGRQYSPELSSLGIFDGASFVLHFSQWSMGLLSGSQPDPVSFGYSGEIREHGLFVQRYSAQGSKRRLSVTMGAIGSYVHGEINREYLAFQTHYTSGAVSAYLSQDVDYNRGWKREMEGQTFLPEQHLCKSAGPCRRANDACGRVRQPAQRSTLPRLHFAGSRVRRYLPAGSMDGSHATICQEVSTRSESQAVDRRHFGKHHYLHSEWIGSVARELAGADFALRQRSAHRLDPLGIGQRASESEDEAGDRRGVAHADGQERPYRRRSPQLDERFGRLLAGTAVVRIALVRALTRR